MQRHSVCVLVGVLAFSLASLAGSGTLLADGPTDNVPEQVRRIPPLGLEVPAEIGEQLRLGLDTLGAEIEALPALLRDRPDLLALIPDVEIYHKAVRYALDYQEFQRPTEFDLALAQLATARERAQALREGAAPWLRQSGSVLRGFRSRLDDTVQPYGVRIPEACAFASGPALRLDLWFHGRGERTNEVAFIEQQERGRGGPIAPKDTIVLYPYARYSNANKFAGEVDCLEALEHARRFYPIDAERTFVRGFSMGGAACWQFAVHYPGRWAGATPGAGFSETPDFLRTFQGETLDPYPWERKLWRWYDCTDWAINLSNCPTIAYSGERDKQKQAADKMSEAMASLGMELVHVIGPDTAHKIHPDSLAEIEERLAAIAEDGRRRVPQVVRFKTYTLRYNRSAWLTIDALTEHWEPGQVQAKWVFPGEFKIRADGVDAFTLHFGPGDSPFDPLMPVGVEINRQRLEGPTTASDRSWKMRLVRDGDDGWLVAGTPSADRLRKRHGLTGPIDDAFMDSFLFVKPSGTPQHGKPGAWVESELDHAVTHWRQQMRGDARVVDDAEITDVDLGKHHLVLWGDPSSNSVLAKIAGQLPIGWNTDQIRVGDRSFDAADHSLVMIYPNPLNPAKYVVLNSSFTYREYAYLNNARQTPKLPDWAVINVSQPVTTRFPGGVAAAGFFDEAWRLKTSQAR